MTFDGCTKKSFTYKDTKVAIDVYKKKKKNS